MRTNPIYFVQLPVTPVPSGLNYCRAAERGLAWSIASRSGPVSGMTAEQRTYPSWIRNTSSLPLISCTSVRRLKLVKKSSCFSFFVPRCTRNFVSRFYHINICAHIPSSYRGYPGTVHHLTFSIDLFKERVTHRDLAEYKVDKRNDDSDAERVRPHFDDSNNVGVSALPLARKSWGRLGIYTLTRYSGLDQKATQIMQRCLQGCQYQG